MRDKGFPLSAVALAMAIGTSQAMAADVFISEIHYDNAGTDQGESIEISGPAGIDLSGYALVLYNGNGGAPYNTVVLDGVIPDLGMGQGAIVVEFPTNGLQNGSPDGVALLDASDMLIEFLSYEGIFTATSGPAAGVTSTDIGVAESSSTAIGDSLQRIAGIWQGPLPNTFVTLAEPPPPPLTTTLISAIQGPGDRSPLNGQVVIIEGIVVGDFQDGDGDDSRNLGGFFVQEEDSDADGSVQTSEGIFVFDGGSTVDVMVGDRVRVRGTVDEYFGETQIEAVSPVVVVDSGNPLPSPAEIMLPTFDVTVNQNDRFQPDLEAFEGMRVVFSDELTVNEMFQLDRFNEIKLVQGERPEQFTQANIPDPDAYAAYLEALGQRQITYDDGLNRQNALIANLDGFGPVFSTESDIRMGDTIVGLSGVLDYKWAGNGASGSTWRVRSTVDGSNVFIKQNARTPVPEDGAGRLWVVAFNVLNYFATIDERGVFTANGSDPRGADNADELDRQTEKLVTAILALDADVLGLVELENDFDAASPGNAIARLTEALNAASSPGEYAWVDPGMPFVGVDAISTGFIYRPSTVAAIGRAAVLDGPAFLDPNDTGLQRNRPAVAQTFEEIATGERFTAVVNHFKSKGRSDFDATASAFALADDDQGDGQGYWNDTRWLAAVALADWLATDPTGSFDPDVLILGDLNAYAMEDPISALSGAGFMPLAPGGPGPVYSYVFDGQTGTLDYALANDSLSTQVSSVHVWHVNADEPDALDYNLDFGRDPEIFDGTVPYRNSDHDPIIVGLSLDSVPPSLEVEVDKPVLWPPNGRYVTVSARVSVWDETDPDPEISLVSVTSNEPDNGKGDGDTVDDIVILDDNRFDLRAERSGTNDGRVYTITYQAIDAAGNMATQSVEVVVPKAAKGLKGPGTRIR